MELSSPIQLLNKYQNNIPEHFYDQISLEVMKNPVIHSCGNTFERESINTWVINRGTCPTCRARSRVEDFRPNLGLKGAIEDFPNKALKELEIRDNKIVQIENEKQDLQADLRVANNEKALEKHAKIQALTELKEVKKSSEYQNAKKLKLQSALKDKYPVGGSEGWTTKLFTQKKDAKENLEGIFKGFRLFGFVVSRPNFFVKPGVSNDERERSKEVLDDLLRLKKQEIMQLTLKKMSSYEGIFEGTKVKFNNQEYQKLVLPIFEDTIGRGILVDKAVDHATKHGVIIKDKRVEGWNAYESNRYLPKTYEETLIEILSESLRYELAVELDKIVTYEAI